jgi:hypothetical protein
MCAVCDAYQNPQVLASSASNGGLDYSWVGYVGSELTDFLGSQSSSLKSLNYHESDTVTYSFFQTQSQVGDLYFPDYVVDGESFQFTPFTLAEQGIARSIIDYLDALIELDFVEVGGGSADINIGKHNSTTGGYAQYPFGDNAYLYVDDEYSLEGEYNSGTSIFVHELGHALGLSHPFEGGQSILNPAYDTNTLTAMSYNFGEYYEMREPFFRPLDMMALYEIYGLESNPLAPLTVSLIHEWEGFGRVITTETGAEVSWNTLYGELVYGSVDTDTLVFNTQADWIPVVDGVNGFLYRGANEITPHQAYGPRDEKWSGDVTFGNTPLAFPVQYDTANLLMTAIHDGMFTPNASKERLGIQSVKEIRVSEGENEAVFEDSWYSNNTYTFDHGNEMPDARVLVDNPLSFEKLVIDEDLPEGAVIYLGSAFDTYELDDADDFVLSDYRPSSERSVLVDGGAGDDTILVQFGEDYASHSLTAADGALQYVETNSSGGSSSIALKNFEKFVFIDSNGFSPAVEQTLAVSLDTEGATSAGAGYRLYKAAFDRTPDEEGLGYWINELDQGYALHEVANSFVISQEFKNLYGADLDNSGFITALYNNVLDRDPDQGGLDYWINDMGNNGMSRADVLASFSESAENIANTDPLIELGVVYQPYGDALIG